MNRMALKKNAFSATAITALLISVLTLAACGQRGPLFLPDEPADAIQEQQQPPEQPPGSLQEPEVENEEIT